MANTKLTIRMDSEVKWALDKFCEEVGMNTATAINMFARAVLREKRLPFEVESDQSRDRYHTDEDFFSDSHQEFLRESIAQIERGEGIVVGDVSEIFAERA